AGGDETLVVPEPEVGRGDEEDVSHGSILRLLRLQAEPRMAQRLCQPVLVRRLERDIEERPRHASEPVVILKDRHGFPRLELTNAESLATTPSPELDPACSPRVQDPVAVAVRRDEPALVSPPDDRDRRRPGATAPAARNSE